MVHLFQTKVSSALFGPKLPQILVEIEVQYGLVCHETCLFSSNWRQVSRPAFLAQTELLWLNRVLLIYVCIILVLRYTVQ